MVPAIRIVIEAIDGAITTGEANIIKTRNCQPTVCSNIHEVLFFPSLHSQSQNGNVSWSAINLLYRVNQ